MKKSTLVTLGVIFAAVFVVLLGLLSYTMFLFFNNSTSQQNFQNELGGMRSSGVTGSGMMGSGMMGSGMMSESIESEHDFLVHMIAHHEEAVSAAGVLKENTEREEMKKFAEDIIKTQSAEIEQMKIWLEAWYPNEDHSVDYQPMMRDLSNLKGDALDQAFLQDMIFHHMEAVMMSQQMINGGLVEHSEIIPFAVTIRNTQRDEIHMMRNWLSEWF